ncbi:MFS transporter [Agrobacterium vitis]|uniref:MFS transporter n=1 Tax=Agrobacterium vitis TaxID=373 RepID=A0A6L6VKL4_AGRVI|nr:MFS transporter [Agrobacterium vitis]MUZ76106.1 MFS transporter [Agrobacterium vitis]
MNDINQQVDREGTPERWHVMAASFASYAFDAMDFMLLALALPIIIKEWNLSLADAGLLGTAGMIGVGLSSVVVGWCSDNYGRKLALIISLLVFGLFTSAAALATGWWDMLIVRFIAGLGLGGVWGVAAAFVNETWPKRLRGRAISFVLSAWPIGFGIAALLAHWIMPEYGWRVLFLCGGGAVVTVVYIAFFVPESEVWITARQAAAGAGPKQRTSVSEIFSGDLRRRTILGTLAASCALVGYWGTNTWLPTYLVQERGLDASHMTNFIIMLNVGMFVGYQIFGFLADKLGRRTSLLICFAGATVMLPIYASIHDTDTLFWMGPLLAVFFAYAGPFGSYFPELYPARVRGMGAGFCFNVGRGISAFAPFVLGQIGSRYGLATGIGLCAIGFLGAGITMLFLPETRSAPAVTPEYPAPGKVLRRV